MKVTLDGEPVAGATVMQGGRATRWVTGADGRVEMQIDRQVDGQLYVIAAHPEARSNGAEWDEDTNEIAIALHRFSLVDNEQYVFADPGDPSRNTSTATCAHCHRTLNDDWYASPHRSAASNPVVQDVFAGVATARSEAGACSEVGGQQRAGLAPGTGESATRCYVGDGVLPALNPGCAESEAGCDTTAVSFGGCANCHAPGIDGKLGGRSLLEARGFAYEYGVHCDVCHHVASIDLSQPAGVGGRLRLVRPSEPSPTPSLGAFLPLTFGPFEDVVVAKMGAVRRDFFHEATLCAGCHQDEQPALVPGQALDPARWPTGLLPAQTTFAEWQASPMNPSAPCQSCHMPPAAHVSNGIDLQDLGLTPDVSSGWARAAGSIRHHSWVGPRQPESKMLSLAAALFIEKQIEAGEVRVSVTVKNVGPGHAIPTGEPMRSLVLIVEARCGETPLRATAGDAVPDFGGYLERRTKAEGFTSWEGARVGDVVRVIRRAGGYHDYQGFGPFGDGRFTPEQKGMPHEDVVGEAIVTSVSGSSVTFDRVLPDGDIAYRGEPLSATGDTTSRALAGAPGFAFARVMAAADGRRMVPHFLAVDVASDNRLLPQQSWTSQHRFATTCPTPEVRARLVHRAYPIELARERGWELSDSLMTEAVR